MEIKELNLSKRAMSFISRTNAYLKRNNRSELLTAEDLLSEGSYLKRYAGCGPVIFNEIQQALSYNLMVF